MKRCYDCGVALTKENETKEHIPARNLYNGYPSEYKNNRLTVSACHTCNNKYSKIDQEIRDAIGIMNDTSVEQQEITRQAVKSIMRRGDWEDRVEKNKNGDVVSVSFNYQDLKELHIKNFKGIFYDMYGYPVPDKMMIEIVSNVDLEDQKLLNAATNFYFYLNSYNDWKVPGHEELFSYSMKTMAIDKNEQIIDNGDPLSPLQ